MMKSLSIKNEVGFTLIELMIVVTIIGILAVISVTSLAAHRERSFIASMQADCQAIRTAEEAYFVDNNTYLVTNAPATDLANHGFKALSSGNAASVGVAVSGTIAEAFKVTVTNASRTAKSVVYDSTLGTTVIN